MRAWRRRIEHHAAIDDAQRAVHAQPKSFEHGGEMPGVDRLAVDGGLAAHGLQAGAVEEGRTERMTCQNLVEPRERRCGALDGANHGGTGQRAQEEASSRIRPPVPGQGAPVRSTAQVAPPRAGASRPHRPGSIARAAAGRQTARGESTS